MEKMIGQVIAVQLSNFSRQLADMLNSGNKLSADEIVHLWDSVALNVDVDVVYKGAKSARPKPSQAEPAPRSTEAPRAEPKPATADSAGTCTYTTKRGKSPGVCGKKALAGRTVCSAHKKYDTDATKDAGKPSSDMEDKAMQSDVDVQSGADDSESPKPGPKPSTTETCLYETKRGKNPGVCGKKTLAGKPVCSAHKKYESDFVSKDDEDDVDDSSDARPNTCTYILTKGKKPGTACGKPAKEGSLCSRHAPSTAEKTSSAFINKLIDGKKEKPAESKSADPKQLVLRMDKTINRLTHKQTGMVFNSDKVAVGHLVDGVVNPLSPADIETCKQYGFKFEEPVADKVEQLKKKDVEKIIENLIEKDDEDDAHVKEDVFEGDTEDENLVEEELDEEELDEEELVEED